MDIFVSTSKYLLDFERILIDITEVRKKNKEETNYKYSYLPTPQEIMYLDN